MMLPVLLVAVILSTLTGCAGVQSLTPGTGSSISVHDRTYAEVWEAGVFATQQHLTISDTNRFSGVIRASSGRGIFSSGEVVSVFINPAGSDAIFHTVEIVSRDASNVQLAGSDWEPRILSELKMRLPNSTSDVVQHNSWQVITLNNTFENIFLEALNGDSLSVIENGNKCLIHVSSIVQIQQTRPSHFWKGARIGVISGVIVGGLIGLSTFATTRSDAPPSVPPYPVSEDALYGGLAGIAIGGLIGSSFGGDVVYNLAGTSLAGRIAVVRSIIAVE